MSFRGPSRQLGDAKGAEKSTVTAALFQLNTAVAGYRRLADAIGTAKETSDTRKSLQDAVRRIGQLTRETSEKLRDFSGSNRDGNPEKRAEETKLARDFQGVLQDFQKAQRIAAEREAAFLSQRSSSLLSESFVEHAENNDGEERASPWGRKRQEIKSLENEIAYNEAIIKERDQGFMQINTDVEQVNDIYRDLAVLIHNQNPTIDDIERQVEAAAASTALAKSQLNKDRRRRSKSQCWIYSLVIFVLALVILLVVLILQ